MKTKEVVDDLTMKRAITRITYEIIERNKDLSQIEPVRIDAIEPPEGVQRSLKKDLRLFCGVLHHDQQQTRKLEIQQKTRAQRDSRPEHPDQPERRPADGRRDEHPPKPGSAAARIVQTADLRAPGGQQ